MAGRPIYSKDHPNHFFSRTEKVVWMVFTIYDLADILHEAYGESTYIKSLKSFRSDHKQTLSGWGKIGKNDVKFRLHGLFELVREFFIGLLKTMY